MAARPEDLQLRFNLAVTLQEAGEWAEAESLYKSLVKQKPSFAAAWANLGAILHKQDRVEEALPALRRALELEPQHLQARLNLANALEQASRLDEAEEQLRPGSAGARPSRLLILAAKPSGALLYRGSGGALSRSCRGNLARFASGLAVRARP